MAKTKALISSAVDLRLYFRICKWLVFSCEGSFHIFPPQTADTRKTKGEKPTLDSEEFVKFYNLLTERPEIEELFLK